MKKIYTLMAAVVLTVLGAFPLSAADYSAKLVIGDLAVEPGVTYTVPLTLEVPAAANATGMNVDITLPEGISFVKHEDEYGDSDYFFLNSSLRKFVPAMSPSSPTEATVIIYPMIVEPLPNLVTGTADKVELGTFYIKVADDFKGCGGMTMSNAKVSSSDLDEKETPIAIPVTLVDGEVFVPVEGVSLPEELALVLGEEKALTLTFTPPAAEGNPVEWTSSDATVASVDENGTVKALKVGGPITITATSRGKSATCEVTVSPVLVTKISVEGPASLTKGETGKFTATVTPEDATDNTITWSSSDTEVATIDKDGTVTALGAGTTTITATANDGSGVKGEATLNVVGVLVSSISLDKTEETIKDSETVTLTATIAPENADNKEIEWTSSDEEVATVADGVVTGVAPGTATITAKALGGNEVTATCKITVEATLVEKIEITAETPVEDFTVGSTIQLIATVTPNNATDKTVTWSSTDEKIATVDENGLVTAVAVGIVEIKATANDESRYEASFPLEVLPVLWETLTLDITEYEMIAGEEVKMHVTGTPDNVTNKTLIVSVEPAGVVEASEIDEDGNFTLTAIGEGEATVTVKGADGSEAEATATVKVSDDLVITSSEKDLAERSTITLTANTYGKVEWSIDNEEAAEIVTIVNDGKQPSYIEIKGLKEGETVTVTAKITLPDGTVKKAPGMEFTIKEAKDVNAESISINPKAVTLRVGGSISLSAIIAPANCTNAPATWSSQNSAVASVDSDGRVCALSAGTTYISATTVNFDGTSLTAMAEINVINPSGIDGVESDNTDGSVSVVNGEILTGGKAEVFSITGARVAVSTDGKVTGLPHGIYLVRIADKTVKVRL